MKVVSIPMFAAPAGCSQWPTISDANAPFGYGKSPVLICAPR